MRRSHYRGILGLLSLFFTCANSGAAERKAYLLAYISDSANASPAYWVAKERGIFKKHGLDIELIYISGSTRGGQRLRLALKQLKINLSDIKLADSGALPAR